MNSQYIAEGCAHRLSDNNINKVFFSVFANRRALVLLETITSCYIKKDHRGSEGKLILQKVIKQHTINGNYGNCCVHMCLVLIMNVIQLDKQTINRAGPL